MAFEEIGQILFIEILKMQEYPGAPFTGNIFNDLVMYFFIPTVFIILVVYMMVSRVLPTAYKGMRFLLGIAAYMFIIVGGYYSVFAYLAGPYFIFLIFIMGILFYFTRHFHPSGGQGGGGGQQQLAAQTGAADGRVQELLRLKIEATELDVEIKEAKKLANPQNVPQMLSRMAELRAQIRMIEPKVMHNPIENAQYQMLKAKHHVK